MKVWLDQVEGIVPEVGYHVHWHGLWQELVEGELFLFGAQAPRILVSQHMFWGVTVCHEVIQVALNWSHQADPAIH